MWWQKEGLSELVVSLLLLNSAGSPCQQCHPTGCLEASSAMASGLFPKGRGGKKDLSPPSSHAAFGNESHMGFFLYFTLKNKEVFWRPERWRTSLFLKEVAVAEPWDIISFQLCPEDTYSLFP